MAQRRQGRRGDNFTIRWSEHERAAVLAAQLATGGPKDIGPWLLWRALQGTSLAPAVPWQPALKLGLTVTVVEEPAEDDEAQIPVCARVIYDLCGGSGNWSEPYRSKGYPVVTVTLPEHDVRLYAPPPGARAWGVLCAPPCESFSLAHPTPMEERLEDGRLLEGMSVVNGCLRLVHQLQPRWWALENPHGHLSKWLGPAQDTFEPYEFGDPYSKETCLWGRFSRPARGPFVTARWGGGPACTEGHGDRSKRKSPLCSRRACRAKTPPGFARAFAEANP